MEPADTQPNWKPYVFTDYGRCFGFFLLGSCIGPLYPFMLQFFNVPTSTGSLLFSAASLGGLLISALARWWMPYFGVLRSLQVFNTLSVLSFLALVCVAALGFPFWVFVLLFFLEAVGGMAALVCGPPIIARLAPKALCGRLIAARDVVYGIANFAGPALVAVALSSALPLWQTLALVGLVAFAACPFVLRLPNISAVSNQTAQSGRITISLAQQLCALGTIGFAMMAELLLTSRIVEYLSVGTGMAVPRAALHLSVLFAIFLGARIILSSVRLPCRQITVYRLALVAAIILTLLGIWVHPWAFLAAGIPIAILMPIATDWLFGSYTQAEQIYPRVFVLVGLCLMLLHPVFGNIAETISYAAAMHIVPACLLLALACCLAVRPEGAPQA